MIQFTPTVRYCRLRSASVGMDAGAREYAQDAHLSEKNVIAVPDAR